MNLSELQDSLETQGLTLGEARYVRRVINAYAHSAASGVKSVQDLLAASVDWMGAEMRLQMEAANEATGRGSHMQPDWMQWADRVGIETTAYLTLKAALNGVGTATGHNLRDVAISLMRMLIDEVRAAAFLEADPSAYANAMNHGMGRARGARSERLLKRMRFHNVDIPATPSTGDSVRVGTQLLGLMVEATGLFFVEHRQMAGRNHRKTRLLLVPSESTREWLAKRDDRLRLTMPLHPPLVIPPRDWAAGVDGGYHYDLAGTLPFVRRSSGAQKLALADRPLPLVYSAVNILQRTPWRINAKVHEVVVRALDGKLVDLIAAPQDENVPARPVGLDLEDDEVRDWRRLAADIHQRNERRRNKRADAERAITIASQMAGMEVPFYFPYTLDFRGRAYPTVEFLNPHGPDLVQGLLEFAEGVPLSKVGVGWLAVHGANSLDAWEGRKLTKLPFQQRVDVIREITPLILEIADDPYTHREWTKADAPWQFLAFAFEWAEYVRTGSLTSHIPVGLDGTCNGLQHFSAMLRDPVGAKAVNLMPTHMPQDIYGDVAELVVERLQSEWDKPAAAGWLASGLVTRSLVKRPVMTLTYGATRYGFVDQILDTLRGKEEMWKLVTETFRPRGIRIREAVQYLAGLLWEVLPLVVGGALSAMAWLHASAEAVMTVTGGPISWTVPITGFPARMEYWKSKRTQIKTLMAGTLVRPSIYTATNTPMRQKTINAISPNIVHSLDAAAMFLTTVGTAARGVPAFSMVHDRYAVHAEHIPTLADVLRTSFIELYSHDILAELREQWQAQGAVLTDPPALGNFNIEDVRLAPYFFS